MSAPSLLFPLPAQSTGSIPNHVYGDLQMNALFSPRFLRILSRPCESETILLRQGLFRLLESAEYAEAFDRFSDALTDLEKTYRLYCAADTDLEKAFLYCDFLKKYRDGVSCIRPLKGCPVTDTLIDYWLDSGHLEAYRSMDACIGEMSALLSETSVFHISFAYQGYILKDHHDDTYLLKLSEYAREAHFDVPQSALLNLPPNTALSASHEILFKDAMTRCKCIINQYGTFEVQDLLSYIPEIQFYREMIEILIRADEKQIPHCYPTPVSRRCYSADNGYDITLMAQGVAHPVPNDIAFDESTPFYFLTGANGGGKTTYLRAVGINLLLFLGGCPIFSTRASVYPFKTVATHFPTDEKINGISRFEDEVKRVEQLLHAADDQCFFLFNETFSGTDEDLGCRLALDTAKRLRQSRSFALFVTHFHAVEMQSFPLLTATVDPANENKRTFRIERVGKGKQTPSHANDILKKYCLDADSLKKRN